MLRYVPIATCGSLLALFCQTNSVADIRPGVNVCHVPSDARAIAAERSELKERLPEEYQKFKIDSPNSNSLEITITKDAFAVAQSDNPAAKIFTLWQEILAKANPDCTVNDVSLVFVTPGGEVLLMKVKSL